MAVEESPILDNKHSQGQASYNEQQTGAMDTLEEGQREMSTTSAGIFFLLVIIALSLAVSVYLAFVGWFGYLFSSRALFTFMVLAIFLPGPFLVLLQIAVDSRYTTYFGAEGAFGFRICFSLAVLAVCVALIPFCSSQWQVPVLGIVIGTLGRAGLSSTLQLASAVDSSMPRYCLAGSPIAALVPIVLTFALAFHADSPRGTAILYCAVPATMTFTVSVLFLCLSCMQFFGDSRFRVAHETLLRSAEGQKRSPFSICSMESWLPCCSKVSWYYMRHLIQWFFDTLPMPFLTFAGGYNFATSLILCSFAAQLLGSGLSFTIPHLLHPFGYAYLPSPLHEFVLTLQVLSLLPLFMQVYGWANFAGWTETVLLLSVGTSYTMSRLAASENAVAALKVVAALHHPAVQRAMQLLCASVQVVAVLCAWAMIEITGLSQ